MSQSRPATSTGGAIAMVLVGGAVATGLVILLAAFASYPSPEMLSFRASTGFYLVNCALCGLVTALGLLLCRPRGPLPPILAAVSALVAFEVGKRIGATLALMIGLERMPDGMVSAIMKPHFNKYLAYELLAVVIAGGIAALRVGASGGFGPAGQRPPAWTGPQPAVGFGQPQPGQPMPGQSMPGQPGQPPMAYPGQPPMAPPGRPYGAPGGQPSFAPPPGGAPAPGSQPPPPSGRPLDAPPPADQPPSPR
ncbi:hypothetical protein ACQPZ8_00740 [Actinomadura nitritigenes]|uniref:hypothetical protein n=1 Tax=Actinomadura nitritigenes TaxID=134602 RepID=UPI003D8A6884